MERARAGDAAARSTLRAYADWLGRFAGDLVLACGAWAGEHLIDGVVGGLGDMLDAKAFRAGMVDKARFGAELPQLPVRRIVHPQPGLLRLAAIAFDAPMGRAKRNPSLPRPMHRIASKGFASGSTHPTVR